MRRVWAILLLILHASAARAELRSFTGAISSDWFDANNWSPAMVPGAGDDVLIAADKTVVVAQAVTINALDLDGTIGGNGDLTVNAAFTWSGGAMTGSGVAHARSELRIQGAGSKRLQRTLVNQGEAEWTGVGDIILNDGVFTNSAEGVLHIRSDRQLRSDGGSALLDNQGTIVKESPAQATTAIGVEMFNAGSILGQAGRLSFTANGTHSGSVTAGGGTIDFAAGAHVLTPPSRLSGDTFTFTGATVASAGSYEATSTVIDSGTLTLTGTASGVDTVELAGGVWDTRLRDGVVVVRDLEQSGGVLTGGSAVVVTGTLDWSGGTMSGTGVTNATQVLILDPQARLTLTRLLTSSGLGSWASPGFLLMGEGGGLEIRPHSVFQIDAAAVFLTGGGTPRIENLGTFHHNAPGQSQLDGVEFVNSDTMQVSGGRIRFDGGYRQIDGFTYLSGGTMASGRVVRMDAGTVLGQGTIEAALLNAGNVLLQPGALLRIIGDFMQAAAGMITVQVASPSSFGTLDAAGASLTGTLSMELVGSFMPHFGDVFRVIRSDALTGDFTTLLSPPLSTGLVLRKIVEPSGVQLQISTESCGQVLCTPIPTPTATVAPFVCPADCDGDESFTIVDITEALSAALAGDTGNCSALDRDDTGALEIDEVVTAVVSAEAGC